MVQIMSVQELKQKMALSAQVLIDVRSPAEYSSVHIPGAELHPLDSFMPEQLIAKHAGATIHLVCHAGNRSAKAATQLEQAGCANVVSISGGTKAWEEARSEERRVGKECVP